jgi:hypothetical protein
MARQPPIEPIALEAFDDRSPSSYKIPQMEISPCAPFMGGNTNFINFSGEHPQAVIFFFRS